MPAPELLSMPSLPFARGVSRWRVSLCPRSLRFAALRFPRSVLMGMIFISTAASASPVLPSAPLSRAPLVEKSKLSFAATPSA